MKNDGWAQYIIVTAEESLKDLEEAVNEKMSLGYIPIGNIGVKNHGVGRSYRTFYQAMIYQSEN